MISSINPPLIQDTLKMLLLKMNFYVEDQVMAILLELPIKLVLSLQKNKNYLPKNVPNSMLIIWVVIRVVSQLRVRVSSERVLMVKLWELLLMLTML